VTTVGVLAVMLPLVVLAAGCPGNSNNGGNPSTTKEPIKFTGAILADIFLGKITKWNDPALQAINPSLVLPDRGIVVVRRAEPSGTTFTFTSYLADVSQIWKKDVGPGAKEVKWWTGAVGKPQSQGVAGHVAATEGAIGYVEMDYAFSNKLSFGSLQNRDGKYVLASPESLTAACKGAEANIPPDLTLSLINQPGEKSYPIVATVWAVLYVNQPGDAGKTLVDFLNWCIHDGQKYTSELYYAPLPESLVQKVDAKLKSVKVTDGTVPRLNGGGSTLVGPMMKKWAQLYQQAKGIEIDYALKGSGNGIQQMTAKTYHFGCTDAPMNEGELKKAMETGGEVLHIPLVFGAVVPIYNLPDLKDK
jgi:phosphate ABC transporter phosphate-binding protein